MKQKTELDSTTKNVVLELMREFSNKEIPAEESVVVYYVQLLMLDPTWGIKSETLPDRNCIHAFVEHCSKVFKNEKLPSIITLKIQLYFTNTYDSIEDAVAKNRSELKNHLKPLQQDILDTQVDGKKDMDKLYKKIVYLLTLSSGLGNPTQKTVYEEAEVALKSIFSYDDLIEFMDLPPPDKENQVSELTYLLTGIRLFNQDCDKGGAGIENLPELLAAAIDITIKDIDKNLEVLLTFINKLTTAVDNAFVLEVYDDSDEEEYLLQCVLPEGVTEDDLEYIKGILVTCRQYELCMRKILVGINSIKETSAETFEKFKEGLASIHNTVQFRIAIPTGQVFPLFTDLAKTWFHIQDQTIMISYFNEMLLNLQTYIKEIEADDEILKLLIGPDGPKSDIDRLASTTGLTIEDIEGDETSLVDSSNIKDFEKVDLQYLGFCAWKFVETNGGLIPGNPNMGIVNVHNLLYVFSSLEAAAAFRKDPVRCILSGLKIAREKPEFINFLQLQEQMSAIKEIEKLVIEVPDVIVNHDVEVETDVHPIPTYIDPNYMWNIWDWKRQAILYANLSRCQTHSCQTHVSKAFGNVKTQTQVTKDFTYQTKKDNYSNVPKVSNFIYGLRGRKDDNQHIITLTRPVDE